MASIFKIGTLSGQQLNKITTLNLNPKINGFTDNGDESTEADSYKVNISQKARELSAEKSQGGEGNASMIDIAIKKIQEQIKAIQEQLEQLKNVEGEAADAQKKMLIEMLGILNEKLMDLMSQKLENQS